MNKRQKKKAVKIALQHFGTNKFNAKDKRILYTYGREAFKSKYSGFEPEIMEKIPELMISAASIWKSLANAVKRTMVDLGDAFIRIGNDFKNLGK